MQYEIQFLNQQLPFHGKKDDAKQVWASLLRLEKIRLYARELNGVIGQEERQCIIYQPYGPAFPLLDEAQYNRDVEELTASLPSPIRAENMEAIIQKAKAIFSQHVPVVDRRRTPEQEAEQQAELKKAAERECQFEKDFVAEFGQPEKVTIPAGRKGVILRLSYDNSDPMSDYFHPYAQYGFDLLLDLVPAKKQERETLFRKTLAKYPDLQKLEWKWKARKLAGGYGNFLESGPTGIIKKHPTYDGGKQVNLSYMIRMQDPCGMTRLFIPYKDYPGVASGGEHPQTPPADLSSIQVIHNVEKQGIEITFPEKPEEDVLEWLRTRGFRWHRQNKYWYARYNEELFTLATGKFANVLKEVVCA